MKRLNAIKKTLPFLVLLVISQPVFSKGKLQPSVKLTPEVTFDKVEEIFGYNLDTDDTLLKNLLLAVAIDYTSPKSPNLDKNIGIPFIVDRGPDYWVSRLGKERNNVEVLVNNALLLLFTKEEIPNAKEAAYKLMKSAADRGYWPADYYVADRNLLSHLTKDFSEFTVTPKSISSEDINTLAQDTMNRFNRCAEIGFAPCQYRIGFWLANSGKSLKEGLSVLRLAIRTTLKDARYLKALDGAIVKAAKVIVFKGEEAGLDGVVREEYVKVIENRLSKVSTKSAAFNSQQ